MKLEKWSRHGKEYYGFVKKNSFGGNKRPKVHGPVFIMDPNKFVEVRQEKEGKKTRLVTHRVGKWPL